MTGNKCVFVLKEWHREAIELSKLGYSSRQIAERLGKGKSSVNDIIAKINASTLDFNPISCIFEVEVEKPKAVPTNKPKVAQHSIRRKDAGEDNSRILFISDLHIPYHHQDALEFLQHLKEKYSPTRVICLGDEVDGHALSFHDHDADLPSAGDEIRQALPVIKQLHDMFPVMDIIESNHGSLIWRKAKTNGIPRHYIKSYNEMLNVSEGWKWSYELNIKLPNGTLCNVHHGRSNDVIKTSQISGSSAVAGHFHEKFKIDYWGNSSGLYFGLQCGCLIDDEAYAFSYNNCNLRRPIIGTGLIIDSQPVLEPMVIKDGRWVGRKK